MVRFTAYVNLYFKNGVFNNISAQPSNYEELAEDLAAAWDAWNNNGDTSQFFSQPCYSHIVGVVGVWNQGELATVPVGRYLPAAQAVAPPSQVSMAKPEGSLEQRHSPTHQVMAKTAKAAASGPPPTLLGPLVAQVDYDAELISLDLSSTMPENGTPGEWPSDLTKTDFRPLTLGVMDGAGSVRPTSQVRTGGGSETAGWLRGEANSSPRWLHRGARDPRRPKLAVHENPFLARGLTPDAQGGRPLAPGVLRRSLRKESMLMKPNGSWAVLRGARRVAGLLPLVLVLAAPSPARAQLKNLVYNSVAPCTVVDTTVAGGAFAPNTTRTYNLVGTASLASQGGSATGCGIPGFANGTALVQAVALHISAVQPSGLGYLNAYAADQAFPALAIVNFQSSVSTLTSAAIVALAQSPGIGDFKVSVCCATVNVVIRVVGYYTKPVETVVVSPVPGDATASGTSLVNALAGINDASAAKPYLVKLEPGIYDLGDMRLQMKAFVDVEGSGQQATVIQGNGNSDPYDLVHGLVMSAASMELRNLQIKCNGSASRPTAIAILNQGTAPRISNVTVVSSGGSGTWGIRNLGASPTIEGTTVNVTGGSGSYSYGIVATGTTTSAPILRRSVINVTSTGVQASGIYSDENSLPAETRDVEVNVSNSGSAIGYEDGGDSSGGPPPGTILQSTFNVHGGGSSYGVHIANSGVVEIKGSNLTASGAASYGVYATAGAVRVDHCEIAGDTNSVVSLSNPPVALGATRLAGPTSGNPHCAGVYDQNLNFYTNTCP